MNVQFRASRRQLMRSVLAGAAVSMPFRSSRSSLAQSQDAPWRPDGPLRLAGSMYGLASLDPAFSRDIETNLVLRQVFRGLVSLDANLDPAPEVAETIDTSADGLRYDFTLRETARFHDGTPISAKDVLFSLTRALDPATAGGHRGDLAAVTFLGDIEGAEDLLAGNAATLAGVEVTGERSLAITLSRRAPAFLMKLASVPASVLQAAQVNADGNWRSRPNGSGPFAVASWDPGSAISLRAAGTWWSGQPAVATVDVRLGVSASQPVNLYQAGDVDLVPSVPPELVDLVQDPASGVTYGDLTESVRFASTFIALGNAEAPLDDAHVRRALLRVFPRELIAQSTYWGEAIPASGFIPPGMLGERWDLPTQPADAAAAREELAKSRYGSAAAVPPIAIYAADTVPVEALRDVAAAELGLTIEAVMVEWPDFVAGLALRRFPAYALYWEADFPDPESMVDMLFATGSADNYTGYSNPELDALLAEARNGDREQRIQAYSQANRLLVDDGAVIPLCHWRGYTLVREGIGGVETTAMGIRGLESLHGS